MIEIEFCFIAVCICTYMYICSGSCHCTHDTSVIIMYCVRQMVNKCVRRLTGKLVNLSKLHMHVHMCVSQDHIHYTSIPCTDWLWHEWSKKTVLIPPTQNALLQHTWRAVYQAGIWTTMPHWCTARDTISTRLCLDQDFTNSHGSQSGWQFQKYLRHVGN